MVRRFSLPGSQKAQAPVCIAQKELFRIMHSGTTYFLKLKDIFALKENLLLLKRNKTCKEPFKSMYISYRWGGGGARAENKMLNK